MVIAIDGPAGCGKSTVAKRISILLGAYYLNTGSFYRAYTLAAIKNGINPLDHDAVLENAKKIRIGVKDGNILLDGVDVEDSLHTSEVDKYCSEVSSDPRLRRLVNEEVRRLAGTMDIITEGRDTTTIIFPDADYKFYFDATPEERASRRVKEREGISYKEVLDGIKKRDLNDREKAFGALKIADDAIYLDTSILTIEEVCEKVLKAVGRL